MWETMCFQQWNPKPPTPIVYICLYYSTTPPVRNREVGEILSEGLIAKWKDEGKGWHNFTCHLRGIKARPLVRTRTLVILKFDTHGLKNNTTRLYVIPSGTELTMCATSFNINEFYILSTFMNIE